MNLDKLKNYITYLEVRYKRTSIEYADAMNSGDIEGWHRNGIIDAELAEALKTINDTLARVARDVKRRKR